jgi:hypothetical protein
MKIINDFCTVCGLLACIKCRYAFPDYDYNVPMVFFCSADCQKKFDYHLHKSQHVGSFERFLDHYKLRNDNKLHISMR